MKLVDPILLPTTLQTFQFREIPEHLWEPNEVRPPDISHCAALETGHVDTDGWRIQASLGLRSSSGMYWSDNQGKPVAQLGTDWQIDQIWQKLLGFLALSLMGGPLFLRLLINYVVISQNEGDGPSAWPDLTRSALLLKDVGSWRRGWHNFLSLLWAMGADSRWLFNTYLGLSFFNRVFNLLTLTCFWISLN